MSLKRLYLFLLLTIIFPALAAAAELEGVQLNAGPVIILNAEDVEVSPAPSPIVTMFGLSFPIYFSEILYFEPGIRLYTSPVILDEVSLKPVPAAIETRDSISVLYCEIRPEVGAAFTLSEKIQLGITGAPVFMLRFPFAAHDGSGEDEMTIVRNYYFSSARFLALYVGGFFTWYATENTAIRLKIGTDLPVYNLWDGAGDPFYDQLTIMPELGILWRF